MNKCGSCTLCCLLTHIPQFDKPVFELCEYCGTGCNIYMIRPQACREFLCVWASEGLPERLRPDKCNVMFERLPGDSTYVGLVNPGYERSWATPEIQSFARGKNKLGHAVVVTAGKDRFIKCPEGVRERDVMINLKKSYISYVTG